MKLPSASRSILDAEMWYIADTPVPDTVQGLVVSLFLFTSLALIVVGLRVYTRVRIVRKMEVDDYLIVVAMVCQEDYAP